MGRERMAGMRYGDRVVRNSPPIRICPTMTASGRTPRKVLEVDPLVCSHCQGRLREVSFIKPSVRVSPTRLSA